MTEIDPKSSGAEANLKDSISTDLRDRFMEEQLDKEEYKTALHEHVHHFVRETTSQVTVEPEEDTPGAEVTSTVTVEDVYYFTCDEWVGVSGVDLSRTLRLKADTYYLGGLSEVLEARQMNVGDTTGPRIPCHAGCGPV